MVAVRSTSMTSLQLHGSGDAPSVAGVGKYSSGSNVTVTCAFHHTAPISTCGGRGPIVGRHHPEQRSQPRFKSQRVESCCLDRLQNLACVARKVESSVDGTIRWTSVITMRWPRYPADHQSCWLQRAAGERLTVRGVGAQTWIALIRRGWLSVRSRMDRVFWPHRPAGWPPVGDVTPRVAVDAPSA